MHKIFQEVFFFFSAYGFFVQKPYVCEIYPCFYIKVLSMHSYYCYSVLLNEDN